MIEVHQMSDLVRDHRTAHFGRGHHQPPVDPDRPAARAAAPATLRIAEHQLGHALPGLRTVMHQIGRHQAPRFAFEPALQPGWNRFGRAAKHQLTLVQLDPARATILVTGGSQGARRLNELSAEAAALIPAETQVLHIAGAIDFERVSQIAKGREGYRVVGFCDQMPSAYAMADVVVARSGASSLTEISIAGHPSILVPYPYAADDHQTRNAEVFSEAGAAILIQEKNLDAAKLADLATSILQDLPTYKRMAKAARALAIPDAAERVCTAIEASLSPQ